MPNFGMVEDRDEHLPQKIWPQARQWCCDRGGGKGCVTVQGLLTPACPAMPPESGQAGFPGQVGCGQAGGQQTREHKGPGERAQAQRSTAATTPGRGFHIERKSS